MPRRAVLLLACLAVSLALVPAAHAAAPTLDATDCDAGQQEALLQAAEKERDEAFARQQRTSPPDRQPTPAQKVKLHVDAVLDRLIMKLER